MLLPLICAGLPTYKYFVIKDGYEELEIHDNNVQTCFDYLCETLPKFCPDFAGYNPVTLIHAWHKKEGNYFAVEVMTQRVRYLITIQIIEEKHYLYSVRILNCDGPGGAKWSQPDQEMIDFAMTEIKEKFGHDVNLLNVAMFTTRLAGTNFAQFVAIVTTETERYIVNCQLAKPFGGKQYAVKSMNRVD